MPEPIKRANTPEKSTENNKKTYQNQNLRCRVHSTKGPHYNICISV